MSVWHATWATNKPPLISVWIGMCCHNNHVCFCVGILLSLLPLLRFVFPNADALLMISGWAGYSWQVAGSSQSAGLSLYCRAEQRGGLETVMTAIHSGLISGQVDSSVLKWSTPNAFIKYALSSTHYFLCPPSLPFVFVIYNEYAHRLSLIRQNRSWYRISKRFRKSKCCLFYSSNAFLYRQ